MMVAIAEAIPESKHRGTGFHGADAEHNCGELRSLPLNINGANTYQFVLSNPVGNVDPWGGQYFATIGRITNYGSI